MKDKTRLPLQSLGYLVRTVGPWNKEGTRAELMPQGVGKRLQSRMVSDPDQEAILQ